MLKYCLLITYIVISYISSTKAYNEEELRRSTNHVMKWIKNDDDREIANAACLRKYLNFTDDNDLSIGTPAVEAVHQHFNQSLFRATLEQDDHWDELDVFFNAMKNLERGAIDAPLNLKACHLLTIAVTKSLISLCIQHSQQEMHPSLKTAKTAWITFIGSDLKKHLSFLDAS